MKHKHIFIYIAAFICILLIAAARHHPPSRRKIKEIWHGRVYWDGESNTTMLRSSAEEVLGSVEPSTNLRSVEPSTNLDELTVTPPKDPPHLLTVTKPMIAICAATHSKSNWRSLGDTALQNLLIPSIQKTISTSDRSKYDFRLYLAADHDDHFWLRNRDNVKTPDWLPVEIGFYEVPEQKIPFNPMMRAAFNDGAEYLVRINDDSEFVTSDWVSIAVAKLASYDPPNVGMVGPNCREGNTAIMTHDMVHRTHLNVFEHYYPDVFSAWWVDDWISKVYGPQRSTKMMDWTVKHHTHKHGTRYAVQHHEAKLLKGELEKAAAKIEAWIRAEQVSRDTSTCSEYAPSKYIWDAGIESSESGLEVYPPNNPSKWSMDSHLLSALTKNHRIAYKEIVSSYQQANFDQKITALGKDFSHQRVATIKNAACDTSGLVVDSDNCLVFRNGGCDIDKNSKFVAQRQDNAPKYDKVITLAMKWGSATWHFVGEALVGLAYVQNIETYKIHVTAKTKFVLEWLRVVGVQEHQIITGTIFAKTLLIPELGKCGNPAPQQIMWLQKKIRSYLPDNQQDKHVLVVKRTKSRTQSNWADILNAAKQISPNVVVHDDSHLPSVQQQLENFRNAHTVIAPHGAGLLNIWASHPNTKVIEFMDTTNMNLCYARLAYILGLNYNAIEMKSSMNRVSQVLQRKTPDNLKPLAEKQNIPNSLRTTPYEKYKMHSKTVLMASFCDNPINKQHVDCASASQYLQDLKEYSGKETREGRDSCKSQHYFPCKFYSQQGEDSVLFNMFFKQQRNGVYLEMGALDGITYSNTKFFEETLGWSGTLIEASIPSYQKLKKNRPKNRLFHNAVCSERKMVTFSGINAEAGIREHMSDRHQKSNRFGDVTSQVQCERLSVLLKGVSKVDLWSLDVEGAEYDVLQSMDWDIPVHVMIIERNPNDLLIEDLLLSKGFNYVREQRGNRIWVNPNYKSLTASMAGAPVVSTAVSNEDRAKSMGTFQINVLTMNRAKSLQRLLDSLEKAEYAGDRVELYIHIDNSDDNRACIKVAKSFDFSHGDVTIEVPEQNNGLRNAWFGAWSPQKNQHAIILEDDIEVSPQWYKWLKQAWQTYGERNDLAGISLQRQTLVSQKPQKQMEIVNNHKPFLYRLVGSIGFSPHWKQWRAFLNWIDSVDTTTVDVKTPGLITSDWLDNLDRRHMWTQYFIWFCKQHDLYTLYVNLPEQKTLAAHMREKGEHFSRTEGRDFDLATKVSMNFPPDLVKYGWDGNSIQNVELGCWKTYQKNIDATKRTEFIPGKSIMMASSSVKLVCDLLNSETRVLEWGSGGSTLFFSKYVKSWDTIEHNVDWIPKMEEYTKKLSNVHFHSAKHSWDGKNDGGYKDFKEYVDLPTHFNHATYDVVIVDGRARVDCARSTLRNHLLSPNGVVLIHDWERSFYKEVLDSFEVIKEDTAPSRHLGILKPKRTPEKKVQNVVPKLVKDGTEYGGWTYDSAAITAESVVYSVGLGEDTSWDEGIMKRFGLQVWGFDPTPKSIKYVNSNENLGQNFHFTPEGLGIKKDVLTFTKPQNTNYVSMREGKHDGLGETIEVPVNSLENWMQNFGHAHLDILKIDIEGSEYDVLEHCIQKKWFPMDQLLVEFHQRFFEDKTRHINVLNGLKANGFEIIHNKGGKGQEISFRKKKLAPKNDKHPIPIVLTGIDYQMNQVSRATIPFMCTNNDRVVILSNVKQNPISGADCLEVVDISGLYSMASSEMPWPKRAPMNQKVYFDRWYVLRDWMRRSGTARVFVMDSDAFMIQNITKLVQDHLDIFSEHELWFVYNPPRSSWPFALLSLVALEDITHFWNQALASDVWTPELVKGTEPNDMVLLGHYSHSAVGKPYPCWGYGPGHKDGTCDNSIDYGHTKVLERLAAKNIRAKFAPGTLTLDRNGKSVLDLGVVDNNYRHDPMHRYEMKNGQKQLQFLEGVPQFKLRKDKWVPVWGYILEDRMEACVNTHLNLVKSKATCVCSDFCCKTCSPTLPDSTPSFPPDGGTKTDYIQLGKIMQSKHAFVNVQLLNHGYVEMTKSWICNVRSFPGVLEKTMFITTDQNAYDQLFKFDSELNIVLELYETPKDLTYGQYAYYDFMLFRTKLLLQLLKNDIVIWLTESDAVWLKDPSDVVLNTKGDMVTMSDGPHPQKILQGGFQLLRPTKPTVSVWTKLLTMFQNKMSAAKKGKEMNDSGSEQLMLNSLIRKEPHLNMQWLDWQLFAPGLYYRDKNKFPRAMVILNNWIKGNAAKIARSKKWNHWYLDENGKCTG